MPDTTDNSIQDILTFLYGHEAGAQTARRLLARLDRFQQETRRTFERAELFSEKDLVLITYADMLREPGRAPLRSLLDFAAAHLEGVFNTIHILPFFPNSSDDGFSVIDYHAVKPAFGTWEDIAAFKQHGFRLMFDAVVNHISAQSPWFEAFRTGIPEYEDYFITADPRTNLSQVTRPRTLPLLTPVDTAMGTRHVWTTFSADQIDLNYANPDVLLEVVDVLLDYLERGADIIRLDAIAFLWKEVGTTCIHLPQTHAVVRLLRSVVDRAAPGVLLITETNVPHEENLSYFGDGTDEAHLVYQFPLPPLAAHALLSGSARYLSEWVASLRAPSPQTTFLNFTASHDGIGLRPVMGILPQPEIDRLLAQARTHGGYISSKANSDDTLSPYELNITYFDLLNFSTSHEADDLHVARFIASQAMMLALAGVPAVYLHSLLGSRNYQEGVSRSGQFRQINREKLDLQAIEAALADEYSLRFRVSEGYRRLLQVRAIEPAFHPNGEQQVVDTDEAIFALLRRSPGRERVLLALHNLRAEAHRVAIDLTELGLGRTATWTDKVGDRVFTSTPPGHLEVMLAPYQVAWLGADI